MRPEERYRERKDLESITRGYEDRMGMKFPKGICICKLDNGRVGIVKTSEFNPEDGKKLHKGYVKAGFTDRGYSNLDIRNACTGNFIKR